MTESLPENIETTYADRFPGDQVHQHHHDVIHGAVNGLAADLAAAQAAAEATAAGALAAHTGDTTDAHDASAISFTPVGTVAATDVQAAVAEVATDAASDLGAHITDTTDAHDASAISYAGAAGLAATDVEAALDELDSEKQSTAGLDAATAALVPGPSATATALNSAYASVFTPEAYGAVGDGVTDDSTAIQDAIDAARAANGGVVYLPSASGYVIGTPITVPSRVRVEGRSSSGNIKIKAAAGLNKAMFRLGATDGTDPNWHWAALTNLYLDGNKANQVAPAAVTITAASSVAYVGTITTSTAHGLSIGDFVEIAGVTPAAYNGRWRVESVPATDQFTIQHLVAGPGPGTVFGTARMLVNVLNVGKGGETSVISNVYITDALHCGVIQGTTGTPMKYANVSTFHCGEYGFDLWCDRPIQLDTPSGDYNGSGLIRLAGTSSAGGSGTGSACLINNIKAEHHTVPVLLLDDYDGAVTVAGGSIDMETGNTAPCIRRTAASSNSTITVLGVRMNPRVSGTVIFADLSSAALSVTTGNSTAESWTFYVSKQPFQTVRVSQRRNDLSDGATVTPNLQNGAMLKLSAGGSRTIAAPTNPPLGAPNAQEIQFDIKNNTAGVITTTWNAVYLLAGAWVDPASTKRRTIRFWYDGSNWVETSRSAADI